MKRILYLGNKLEKHGFSPTSIDTLPSLLKAEGYRVDSVSSIRNKPLRLLHMLGSVILKRNVDLVLIDTYSTTNFWYAVLSAQACLLLSTPYIFILHGGNLEDRFSRSSSRILNLFRKAKANVVPSDFLKDKLKRFQLRNMVYIPNSIELSEYDFIKRNKVAPKLLWVRAFDKVYNPEMAITVLEILRKDYPEAKLCMVGADKDGSHEELKKMAKDEDLAVKFPGKLKKSEWIDLSNEYDIFINTTSIDNTPVSVIEAMALGMPVVSTNVGGIPYLINNTENGLLVDSNDAEAMAMAVKQLIEHPELTEKLSVQGRQKVENFNWGKVKPLWLELLG
ncbi:glycosyltransferase family 4 protein [Christiangramia echinicola]|uniref:glycosyltransferase family 4 protein n=1 Tax=Christiangramia echinicola TaxID=279359 RepID=UPI0003F76DAA|nr:glycosyltransferase family 4 protein [Christiangramia echinicola]